MAKESGGVQSRILDDDGEGEGGPRGAPGAASDGPSESAPSPSSSAHLFTGGTAMRRVLEVLDRVARTDAAVLVTGEPGVGKGLVARTLHEESARSRERFVTVDCSALPEPLLELELFGHVRNAFPGATTGAPGAFVSAHQGTLFLDEIGELSPALQAKLLDVLERGAVRPVGATRTRAVDVRLVTSARRDLHQLSREGHFRHDLLYRIDVVSIALPPLRDRPEDVPVLVAHFLEEMRARHPRSPVRRVSPAVLARLLDHAWPGNVRQLAHVVERLVLLGRSEEASVAELPPILRDLAPAPGLDLGEGVQPMLDVQRRYAQWALARLGGNRERTAEKLGVEEATLARWLAPDRDARPTGAGGDRATRSGVRPSRR